MYWWRTRGDIKLLNASRLAGSEIELSVDMSKQDSLTQEIIEMAT